MKRKSKPAKQTPAGAEKQVRPIVWDTEERHELLDREGHIRDTTMYLTTGLAAQMGYEWGGVVTAVKTSTDVDSGEVTVYKAHPGEEGSVPLRWVGAQNTAVFSFWRPLRKLNLKVPPTRQFNVTPFTREVEDVGTVFIFPMNQRISAPRNRREEAETAAAEETAAASEPPEE